MISLQELMSRALPEGMPVPQRPLTPSLFYSLIHQPFWVWCQYHAPRGEAVEEIGAFDLWVRERGREFERRWISQKYPQASNVEPAWGPAAVERTLELMRSGASAIYQPNLWLAAEEVCGRGDLLVRRDGANSDLGPYYYQIVEIKRSRKAQEHHACQAALYNFVLSRLQGFTPESMRIVLTQEEQEIEYAPARERMERYRGLWREIRDQSLRPSPGKPDETSSPWRTYANQVAAQERDLILIADVGPKKRDALGRHFGTKRIDDIYGVSMDQMQAVLGESAGRSAFFHVRAYREGKPVFPCPGDFKVPRAKRHFYIDFETSDGNHPSEPPHLYLIGLWDKERSSFVHFLGRGATDEPRILAEFLAYAGDPDEAKFYHWSSYETQELRRLAQRHPGQANKINGIIGSCQDFIKLVKGNVYLPVPSYSIKKVAPRLGFQWRHQGIGAFESMMLYWEFLRDPDFPEIQKVLDYNEDDCRAIAWVDDHLSGNIYF